MESLKKTEAHAKRTIFYEWGSRGYNENYGTMYREGDNVVFEHGDYDREDIRLYEHYIKIPLVKFRLLIEEVNTKGTAQMEEKLWSLGIGLADNKGSVMLSGRFFSTPSPSTTPGGAGLTQGILFEADMESVLKGIQ
jgi:hypothetical protein